MTRNIFIGEVPSAYGDDRRFMVYEKKEGQTDDRVEWLATVKSVNAEYLVGFLDTANHNTSWRRGSKCQYADWRGPAGP